MFDTLAVKYTALINFYRDKVSPIESSSFIKFPLHVRQRRFDSDHSRKNFVHCYFILLCSYELWRPYVPYCIMRTVFSTNATE